MAKEVEGFVKLQVRGGQANPSPPVGPASVSMQEHRNLLANFFQL